MEIEKYTIKELDMDGKGVSPQPNPMELPVDQAKAVFDQLTKEVVVPKFNTFVEAFEEVDLTSDADKPVSDATQAALDTKVDKELRTGSDELYKVLSDNNYDDTEKSNVAENTANRHNHTNKATLDKITETHLQEIADNTTARHTHANKETLDKVTEAVLTDIGESASNRHKHSNKGVLDTIDTAFLSNILYKNNTTPYEPHDDYHPATKKYVDEMAMPLGVGDMQKAVYDSHNRNLDVYDYADTAARIQDIHTGKQYQLGLQDGRLVWQPVYMTPVERHNAAPDAHANILIDGNADIMPTSKEMQTHNQNAQAHQNMIVDGNVWQTQKDQTLEEHEQNPYVHQMLMIDGQTGTEGV